MAIPDGLARRRRTLGVSRSPFTRVAAVLDLEPAYWRLLVLHVPGIALDRLTRDIRSGRFGPDGLLARAQDLRAHLRPDIRERARTEFPELDTADDGLEPNLEGESLRQRLAREGRLPVLEAARIAGDRAPGSS